MVVTTCKYSNNQVSFYWKESYEYFEVMRICYEGFEKVFFFIKGRQSLSQLHYAPTRESLPPLSQSCHSRLQTPSGGLSKLYMQPQIKTVGKVSQAIRDSIPRPQSVNHSDTPVFFQQGARSNNGAPVAPLLAP